MQLSQEQIAEFEVEGYLFLPEAFTSAEVAVLSAEVPGIFAERREEAWRERDGKAVPSCSYPRATSRA